MAINILRQRCNTAVAWGQAISGRSALSMLLGLLFFCVALARLWNVQLLNGLGWLIVAAAFIVPSLEEARWRMRPRETTKLLKDGHLIGGGFAADPATIFGDSKSSSTASRSNTAQRGPFLERFIMGSAFAKARTSGLLPPALGPLIAGVGGLLFFVLAPVLGPLWAMGVVILWPFIALYKAARKRLVPCVHGTRGAAADILLCGQCREADFEKRFKRDLVEVRQRMEKKAARQRELAIRKKEFLQKARTLAFLQSLEPKVFQGLICAVYRQKGYDVRETSFTKDGGVDGFLVQGARRLVLQCKRFKGDVGEPVVRDLFGTANHHNADGAVLVTTGRVSRPAQMFSQGKSIELIDGQALLGLLEEVNLSENLVPDDFVATLGERPAVLGQDKKTG